MVNIVTDPDLKETLDILGIPHDMNSLMERLPQSFVHEDGNRYEFYLDNNEDGTYTANYGEELFVLLCSYDYKNMVDAIAYCVEQVDQLIRNNVITDIQY